MSAVYLKLITILCLSCTALSGPVGSSGVVWRDFGGAVTIQCRHSQTDQASLSLKKGLNEEEEILFKDGNSEKNTIDEDFSDRLQLNGVFPNIDIVIKNLTSDDTGIYWCIYAKFDLKYNKLVDVKGKGSVLLVVTETKQQCDQSSNHLILVSVVICAAALLGIIICFIWLILKAKICTAKKPQRVLNNDVYEDMRGTIRRERCQPAGQAT